MMNSQQLRTRILLAAIVLDESLRWFRHLSPSIVSKRIYLAVDLTVSSAYADDKSRNFSCLEVPETIEWE
jgi:hypothetical protein